MEQQETLNSSCHVAGLQKELGVVCQSPIVSPKKLCLSGNGWCEEGGKQHNSS